MVRKRGNSFQADVMVNGVRYRKHFATEEEAAAYELAAGGEKMLSRRPTFQAFYRAHFDYLWGDAKAPHAAQLCLDALDRHIPEKTKLSEINQRFAFDLVLQMKKEGISNGTINRRLSALSKVLRHAERLEIAKRPYIQYQKEPHGRERTLSLREEWRIDEYYRRVGFGWARALTFFLLYTGCRLGEVYALGRDRVEGGRVHLSYETTKTNASRLVPLVGPAKEAWDFICANSDRSIPLLDYPEGTYRNHWNRLRKHLGYENDKEFIPHMLRHTCASRLVSGGVSLPKVMQWMGHKCIQTTLRYSHLVPNDLDEAATVLERSNAQV